MPAPPIPGKAPSATTPPMPGKAPSSAADAAAAAATASPAEDVHEKIGNFNDDINKQKTRLVNVNARLLGVADKIKGFTNNGGGAVKDIEKQIADIKAKAASKKTAAADKVQKGLADIKLDDLKKTIGEIGVVSVQIKSAVASDDGEEMQKDVTDIMPLLKSIKDTEGKELTQEAVKNMFPKVVITKLEEKETGLFEKIYKDAEAQAIGGRKKRKQTKKRRKVRRK